MKILTLEVPGADKSAQLAPLCSATGRIIGPNIDTNNRLALGAQDSIKSLIFFIIINTIAKEIL